MLHGRVLRPEIPRAKLDGLNEDGARAVAGLVAVVRDGNFAGVVCETEAWRGGRARRLAQGRDVVGGRTAAR